ncbi:MAG: hypothetical protein H6739_27635 [Alphaproteobacteria bacterium]|nr:hypothetical protein [Alphaproteobacteria bacterium]
MVAWLAQQDLAPPGLRALNALPPAGRAFLAAEGLLFAAAWAHPMLSAPERTGGWVSYAFLLGFVLLTNSGAAIAGAWLGQSWRPGTIRPARVHALALVGSWAALAALIGLGFTLRRCDAEGGALYAMAGLSLAGFPVVSAAVLACLTHAELSRYARG